LRHLGILPAGNTSRADDKFGCRACVNASGEVSLKGSPIATLRDSSRVSRYLYIDLCYQLRFFSTFGENNWVNFGTLTKK